MILMRGQGRRLLFSPMFFSRQFKQIDTTKKDKTMIRIEIRSIQNNNNLTMKVEVLYSIANPTTLYKATCR